jgi:AcrR family transcriptional regulator
MEIIGKYHSLTHNISAISLTQLADKLSSSTMKLTDSPSLPFDPSSPPGRTRIMNSMVRLLGQKEFHRITTAEIARAAEVTEGLIYKYFRDKKELLFQVLMELFQQVIDRIAREIATVDGSHAKLRAFIRASVASYAESRVFSKIILLEVRNTPSFFASDAYGLVRQYSKMLARILQEGMDTGELAPDIEIRALREIIFGAIEHACLSCIIFNREIDVDQVSEQLCRVLFHGITDPGSKEKQESIS